MNDLFESLKERLCELDLEMLTPEEKAYVEQCEECQNLLATLKQLDSGFEILTENDSQEEPSDESVVGILKSISTPPSSPRGINKWIVRVGSTLAVASLLLVFAINGASHLNYGVNLTSFDSYSEKGYASQGFSQVASTLRAEPQGISGNNQAYKAKRAPAPWAEEEAAMADDMVSNAQGLHRNQIPLKQDFRARSRKPSRSIARQDRFSASAVRGRRARKKSFGTKREMVSESMALPSAPPAQELENLFEQQPQVGGKVFDQPTGFDKDQVDEKMRFRDAEADFEGRANNIKPQENATDILSLGQNSRLLKGSSSFGLIRREHETADSTLKELEQQNFAEPQRLTNRRSQIEDLTFQNAQGYWGNTYLPGAYDLRTLHSRLKGAKFAQSPLHTRVSQYWQPFDPPQHAALAVYLHADRTAITGKTRMLLQVGLKGAEKAKGHRPPMNITVVLDIRNKTTQEVERRMGEVLMTLQKEKDIADTFNIIVVGASIQHKITGKQFTHGRIKVLLNDLFKKDNSRKKKPIRIQTPLLEGMKDAYQITLGNDDSKAPLGSSAVVLLTSQKLGGQSVALQRLAHDWAIAGITTSAIVVSPRTQTPAIETLVLRGQGRISFLHAHQKVISIVREHLDAVSKIIARAVRLRIRLKPGVHLVEVLGSNRLNQSRAAQVKAAEKSIDTRLSRNLGITADRGEDEEGIQIIIPAFYAGDDHVILLDVVADNPGPLADVTARYKDLVHLKNGVARARLEVTRGERKTLSILEENVKKNYLAFAFSEAMQASGEALRIRDFEKALHITQELQQTFAQNQHHFPQLATDKELSIDQHLIAQTIQQITQSKYYNAQQNNLLADSLSLSSKLKVVSRSGITTGASHE